jgi:tol-pal system protein YbgF
MKRGLAVLCLLIASCSSARKADDEPTLVPPPSPTEASTQVLQSQIASLQTSMTELLDRLDVMNARLARLEAPPATQPSTPARVTAPQQPQQQPQAAAKPAVVVSADIAESYQRALMLVGQSKHAEARAAFQQVFDADPTGHLADNALFWIGETYYATGDFPQAIRYYQKVVNEFADENKAPDAMFKLALAYVKTGDVGMARRTLEECIRKYPYSTPAASAKLELQRIKY